MNLEKSHKLRLDEFNCIACFLEMNQRNTFRFYKMQNKLENPLQCLNNKCISENIHASGFDLLI